MASSETWHSKQCWSDTPHNTGTFNNSNNNKNIMKHHKSRRNVDSEILNYMKQMKNWLKKMITTFKNY